VVRSGQSGGHRDIAGEHKSLLDAALAHDADRTVLLFETHIERTQAILTDFDLTAGLAGWTVNDASWSALHSYHCGTRRNGKNPLVHASRGARVFVDQAAQDGFSADLLCVDVGHGGGGSVRFVVGTWAGGSTDRFLWLLNVWGS
jgi:hypothetical protein